MEVMGNCRSRGSVDCGPDSERRWRPRKAEMSAEMKEEDNNEGNL